MKGVLLVNLGSPDSTEVKDVKKYLDQFLMDERVIDLPYLLRAFLVKGIILNTRPKKSAAAYKKIWWEEGSPLIVLTQRLQKKVQELVDYPVEIAMRYGNPSIEFGLQQLQDKGVTEVLLLPLYPQFAMATTETILVLAEEIRERKYPSMTFKTIPAFYKRESYIANLGTSIQEALTGFETNHILFSYHGVPERHIKKSDVTKSHCAIDGKCCVTPSAAHEFCYRHQCYETTRQVAELLQLEEGSYSTSFQSRLGRDPWLQPYTDATIDGLAQKGIKNLAVVTPAFVSDCLETLEEIGMEAAHSFKENGGENFLTVACLNDRDDWAQTVASWIKNWN
ncbi:MULTISPECIES: ferrochelatase [Flavobacterium]|uniref:Ferrochelatase n=2 Tax=Flavobacterium TaxID=237 RepID=A0A2N9PA73_9FLAO|nr:MULTISPECIES: ferrochelatase [Flavobacterium]QYS89972.1 ferrochelatase [Flavobacterium davisii]RVU91143.1 ferrochelatase [Flavobacterium columnare]SPE77226.1 Ferrochelatase [Flavobacterium columnare]